MELNKTYFGDCLELMEEIPDGSIDLILCDLPYGGTKNLLTIRRKQLGILEKSAQPTQKPVALEEYFIKTYTNEGETVLDNACGSGTVGVAAKNLGRNYIQMENKIEYFDISRKRLGE